MTDSDTGSARHLVLVGLAGSGKSTVGRVLADRLGRRLLDTDDEVERRAGRSVREVFADDGEDAFRRMESEVLADALATSEPLVIAAAGGVVLSAANRALLCGATCRVVWLMAPTDVLVARTVHSGHRPLLDADPAGALATMAADRETLYREVADAAVSVVGRTPAEVAEAVLR